MHVIHRTKEQSPRDFIPTQSIFARIGPKLTRNKRYAADGTYLGLSRPKPIPNPVTQAKVRKAMAEGAAKGLPPPEVPFDMATYKPLPRRILVSRGPLITHEGGIAIPDDKQRHAFWCASATA